MKTNIGMYGSKYRRKIKITQISIITTNMPHKKAIMIASSKLHQGTTASYFSDPEVFTTVI